MLIINIEIEFRDLDAVISRYRQLFSVIVPITILPVVTSYTIVLPNLQILDINLVGVWGYKIVVLICIFCD